MKKSKNKGSMLGSVAYGFGMISYNVEYAIVSYLTFALTESYAISAVMVGTLFLVSRLLDGFTDIVAGYVIDRFNPKVGKARVYDLLHIPLWICLVLVFSVPDIGLTGKLVWVFIFYNLLQSVIATFMNVAEPLRLQRSFKEEARYKVMAVTSIMTILFSTVSGVLMPILIGKFSDQPHGWTIITLIMAVPFAIFGTLRFILLPELPEMQKVNTEMETLSIKESLKALIQNKYALLYGGLMICWAMFNTLSNGASTYYFQYVYGDVSIASIVSLPTLFIIFFIAIIPKITTKLGRVNTIRMGVAFMAISRLAALLMPKNIMWLAVMNLVTIAGMMILSFMKPLLTIDCITYGKWKTGNAIEAAYSTVNSLTDKIGLGLGSIALGAILGAGGYDGALAIQPESAVFTIKMLYTAIPAMLMLVALVIFIFYNLESKLPRIQQELQEREKNNN